MRGVRRRMGKLWRRKPNEYCMTILSGIISGHISDQDTVFQVKIAPCPDSTPGCIIRPTAYLPKAFESLQIFSKISILSFT